MATARVISVNTGRGRDAAWAGRVKRTAIDKRPAPGPVAVGRLGLAGDEQVDKPDHGGYEQALYAYAREAVIPREDSEADSWQAAAQVMSYGGDGRGEGMVTRLLSVAR